MRNFIEKIIMKYRITSILATILLLVLLFLPGKIVQEIDIPGNDKLAHFIMFFGHCFALRFDFSILDRKPIFLLLSGLFIALGTELVQPGIQGRSFDLMDILFDVIGILIMVIFGSPLVKIVKNIILVKKPSRGICK